jgi:tetratricopeptide (TPR) repeat protein
MENMSKRDEAVYAAQGETSLCLNMDQMADYVGKKLAPGQRLEIEAHLDECRLCSEAVAGVRLYPSANELREMFEPRSYEIHLRPAMIEFLRKNWKSAYAIAAVLVIGLSAVLYLTKADPEQMLFAESFHRYPGPASLVRGEQADGKLAAALGQYEAENLDAALKIFQEILAAEPGNTTAHFYAGLVCLELQDSPSAIAHLQSARSDTSAELAEPAAWYLALAYLRKHDIAEAKSRLSQIIAADGAYQEKAAKLLERLSQ